MVLHLAPNRAALYRINLDQFEGPLDLLLFFIKRDELDIYDIPIAQITDEFLEYIRILEQIDLDRAADFIYMAALLIEIKVRMLLPRPEVDEEGEPIDPRMELVNRLIEYTRFKEAAQKIEVLEAERSALYTRAVPDAFQAQFKTNGEEPAYDVSIFHLISALKRVLEEASEPSLHRVVNPEYRLEEQRAFVLSCLHTGRSLSFRELVSARTKPFIIVTFLAILELVREGLTLIVDRVSEDGFYLQKAA